MKCQIVILVWLNWKSYISLGSNMLSQKWARLKSQYERYNSQVIPNEALFTNLFWFCMLMIGLYGCIVRKLDHHVWIFAFNLLKNHNLYIVPTCNYSRKLEESTALLLVRAYIMLSELDSASRELVIILDIGVIYNKIIKTHKIIYCYIP